jgi:transcriptional regulator with XRE-family HTH domain
VLENINELFIQNLIRLRQENGMTQAEMAEAAGVDIRTYQKYEYKQTFPRPDKIRRMARALGVTESDLFKDPSSQSETTTATDRAQRTLRLQTLINQLSDDDFDTIETTVEGLAQLAPNKSSIAR